jgi:hypothetical protein
MLHVSVEIFRLLSVISFDIEHRIVTKFTFKNTTPAEFNVEPFIR